MTLELECARQVRPDLQLRLQLFVVVIGIQFCVAFQLGAIDLHGQALDVAQLFQMNGQALLGHGQPLGELC